MCLGDKTLVLPIVLNDPHCMHPLERSLLVLFTCFFRAAWQGKANRTDML